MYTTVEKVRVVAGFTDNNNISDATILQRISAATSRVNMSLGVCYSLPLPYHRQASITIGGTTVVSGGTIDFVVNGITYQVTTEIDDTPQVVANRLRDAMVESQDFITNTGVGVEEVILVSISDSSDLTTANNQVNITSLPADGDGLTFTKSVLRTNRHIPYIDHLTAELTASMLLFENYGIEVQDTPQDGNARQELLELQLRKLQSVNDNEEALNLFDEVTGVMIPKNNATDMQFFPTQASDSMEENSSAPLFTRNQIF